MSAATREETEEPGAESAWQPLRHPLYRAVWLASVASQIGTWIHDVGAAWLMTSLSPSPLMVSMVQAATSLPLFLLAIPAGALADIVDRRRMLIGTQVWMGLAALALALSTAFDQTGPTALLLYSILLSVGAALAAPAWQATTPELVPREELSLAVSLNGMAINLSRSIGPAVGGVLVGLYGPESAFALNAVSFVAVLFVLARWRREPERSGLPAERFLHAIGAGLRYARHAEGFRSVLLRAVLFLFPASALWALLPHLAKRELDLSALGYGVLMAAVGIGALLSASILPRLRKSVPQRTLTAIATIVVALGIVLLSRAPDAWVAWPTLLVLGMGWLVMLSSLHLGAQSSAAGWARARALSVFLFVFFGSMALGSLCWGAVAEMLGVRATLVVAGAVTAAAAGPALFFPLATEGGRALTPSLHWPAPEGPAPEEGDAGPVLIRVEYRVAPEDRAALFEELHRLRPRRLRDGGYGWDAFEDPEVPGHVAEVFYAASWLDHLRQHERVTLADRAIQDRIRSLQTDPAYPRVEHRLGFRADT